MLQASKLLVAAANSSNLSNGKSCIFTSLMLNTCLSLRMALFFRATSDMFRLSMNRLQHIQKTHITEIKWLPECINLSINNKKVMKENETNNRTSVIDRIDLNMKIDKV